MYILNNEVLLKLTKTSLPPLRSNLRKAAKDSVSSEDFKEKAQILLGCTSTSDHVLQSLDILLLSLLESIHPDFSGASILHTKTSKEFFRMKDVNRDMYDGVENQQLLNDRLEELFNKHIVDYMFL